MRTIPTLAKRFSVLNQFSANSRQYLYWPLFFLFFIFKSQSASASHCAGGEITYQWLFGNTYQFTATIYRDCAGIPAPNTETLNIMSANCGVNVNLTMGLVPGTGQEITTPCPNNPTTCSGGTNAGYQKWQYVVTYNLGMQCTDWVFSYTENARNAAITTIQNPGAASMYIAATLNNVVAPTNSSPTFSNVPVTILCEGQSFNYNPGGFDVNGDSLVYSFISPRNGPGNNVTFIAPYSATNPISSAPPATINPVNGNIQMTPNMIQIGITTELIQEYQNGVLIGSVARDMQFVVIVCSSTLPSATGINGTNNFTSTVSCPGGGTQICFNINSNDTTPSAILTMTWNSGITGATFNVTGSPHPTGQFCWTPTVADVRSQPYTFTVTVHDNSCPYNGSQTYSYAVYVLSSLNASISATNVSCNGGTDGSTAINASSTNPPITYSWSSGQSTSSISGLPSGTYLVTVTDGNGCTGAFSQTVTQPAVIATIMNPTNPSCNNGNNGSILLYTGGGTPPFTYYWNNGETNYTATNLSAGSYSVTVTDAHGCTNSFAGSLTQPSALSASTSQTSACAANSGSASVTATGGIGPYTYLWSDGTNGSTATGLTAGNYTLTVTDSKGCTIINNFTIPSSPAINLNVTSTGNVACGSSCTGTGAILATGGTPGFTYTWISGQTSSSASSLCAGSYLVTVTDAANCTALTSVAITQPSTLAIDTAHTDILCHGGNSGTASLTVSGGNAPYTYLWSNGATTTSVSGLTGGTYLVTITDSTGCKSIQSINILQPTAIVLSTTSLPSCSGPNNGQATVSAIGGVPSYNYSWSNGGNTTAITNISGGTYTILVTDSRDCTSSANVVVGGIPVITINPPPSICNGQSDSLTATGALTYVWSPAATLSSSTGATVTATPSSTTTYTVTGTGTGGCTNTTTTTVTIFTPPTISITPALAQICRGSSITLTAAGGVSYVWSPATGLSSSTGNIVVANPTVGTSYTVTATDANGCTNTAIKFVTVKINPVFTYSNFALCSGSCINMSLSYFNSTSILYSWNPSSGLSGNLTTGTPLACPVATTTYTVIGNLNNCKDTQIVVLTVNPDAGVSICGPTTICNGMPALLTACGGGAGYSYQWSSGQLTSSISTLISGTYTVTATNSYGCSATATTPVTINALQLNFPRQYYICESGAVTLTASGGLTYAWSPSTGLSCTSCANPIATPFSNTLYIVTVTYGNCTDTAHVEVDQAPPTNPPNITYTTATGDTVRSSPEARYQWYFNGAPIAGATDSVYYGSTCGNYAVQYTDSFGCTKISSSVYTCPLGIGELTISHAIWIYPNPAGNMFTIYGAQFMAGTKVQLYNVIGEKILNGETQLKHADTEIKVDISTLSKGVYFIQVINGEKVYRSKVIKE